MGTLTSNSPAATTITAIITTTITVRKMRKRHQVRPHRHPTIAATVNTRTFTVCNNLRRPMRLARCQFEQSMLRFCTQPM